MQLQNEERSALQIEQARQWYEAELQRVERRARRDDPEVCRTLGWSLPWFRAVIAGDEPPVLPPPMPQRPTRAMHGAPQSDRTVLSIGA